MKRVISWLCLAALCFCLGAPVSAQPLDTERECSLTLQFSKEDNDFSDVAISIYRVAQANPDGTFDKITPFDAYAVSIYDITDAKGWSDLAHTLSGYIVADRIAPTAKAITDDEGKAKFADLPTGLYLVDGVIAENEEGMYTFDPFMVYLPTQNEGEYTYDVVAKPKADHFEPAPEGTEYRVLKLWEDIGYTDRRPTAVTVELYRDGALFETVSLSDANDWCYTWTDPGQSTWTVVERDVSEEYQVFVSPKDTTFIMTNQWNPDDPPKDPPADPPDTGDTSPIWLYVLVLCLSGLGVLIVGLALLRGTRDAKKRQ